MQQSDLKVSSENITHISAATEKDVMYRTAQWWKECQIRWQRPPPVTHSGKEQLGSVATGLYVLAVSGNHGHKCVCDAMLGVPREGSWWEVQTRWTPSHEETLLWISSPVLGRKLYSPSGLIALLDPIIQTWMNTKHLTPPFLPPSLSLSLFFSSLHIQSLSLPVVFMLLPPLALFWMCSLRPFFPYSLLFFLKTGQRETDWPLQGPKAWGNPGIGL